MSDLMKVPLLDLKQQYWSIQPEVESAIKGVLENGVFILGPNLAAFEQEVAEYLGVKHAIGVASGTDALVLTLRAMGIGPGDEVIVPAFTFFATAGAVMLLGATPVLVDVVPDTLCMDMEKVESLVGPKTKAIIPVHLFGQSTDMDPLLVVAERHGLMVIEDNAQAFGAGYRGQKTGSLSHAGCLSFYPTKNLGAYGDGGMIVTDDDSLYDKLMMLRTHGWTEKYYSEMVGYNSRLDELQAAILRVKLKHLDSWNDARRDWAAIYSQKLAGSGVAIPRTQEYAHHIYHLYVIELANRSDVIQDLNRSGISTAVYYPYPLHLVPAMDDLGYKKGDFPVSESASERCLAIPLFPEMTSEQVDRVVEGLRQAVTD